VVSIVVSVLQDHADQPESLCCYVERSPGNWRPAGGRRGNHQLGRPAHQLALIKEGTACKGTIRPHIQPTLIRYLIVLAAVFAGLRIWVAAAGK